MWRSRADLDAPLAQIRGSAAVGAALALVAGAETIELEPLGGKGPAPASSS